MEISKFVDKQRKLLNLEKEADREEAASLKRCVSCTIVEVNSGLGGRYDIKLKIKNTSMRLSSGETITLRPQESNENPKKDMKNEEQLISGVISVVTDKFIIASMDDFFDEWWDQKLLLARIPDEVTYKRMEYALDKLEKYEMDRDVVAKRVIDVVFGKTQPRLLDEKETKNLNFYNKNLNDSQKEAVKFALRTEDIALVWGPPGTGKTTTVVEIIRQAVNLKQKVLVCGPSNISIDNIVEKLEGSKIKMIRLGHPARLMDSVMKYSLDYALVQGDGSAVISDIRKDLTKAYKKLQKAQRRERRELYGEIKLLKKELRNREAKAIEDVIKFSQVILCTCSGADHFYLRNSKFDLVIVDEAAQCLEAMCWIPMLKGKRSILCGDDFQLNPTIMSEEAKKKGLGVTLFERLHKKFGDQMTRMLKVQYRMNEEIMKWSSKEFYNDELIAHESVKDHLLTDLEGVEEVEETMTPLFCIDTANVSYEEEGEEGESKFNNGEADLVVEHVKRLLDAGVTEHQIAVISPYAAQVQLLKTKLEEHSFIEIGTVDGFQGREKDAVIVSMVRSNKKGEVGFLSDERRTNVAITRAKRHVCLIGDTTTLRTSPFLNRLAKYFQDNADYREASEYI